MFHHNSNADFSHQSQSEWRVNSAATHITDPSMGGDDSLNPATEPGAYHQQPVSIDDQIKAYEAMQAEVARHRNLQSQLKLDEEQKQRRRRKCVSFAGDALLYSSDRTYEEVRTLWYSKAELSAFKNERKEIVKLLKETNFDLAIAEQHYCLRGYEPYFSMEVNKAMKYARTLVTSLLLAEQERQRSLGSVDEESIRISCAGASEWARENAVALGQNDELEAYGEYIDPSEICYADVSGNKSNEAMYLEPSVASETTETSMSLLGKRKDAVEQPEFSSRLRAPDEEDPSEDPLAERLDSALKLVEALKFGGRQ